MYQMEVDKIKEMIGDAEKEQIGKDLAVQKAVDFVVKNAVEVEPAEEDKRREIINSKRMEVSRNGISTLRD